MIQDFAILHERPEQALILKTFLKHKKNLILKFAFGNYWRNDMKALDYIADYFGEKKAFYITWLIHYTSWLIYPSFVGLVIYLIQIVRYFHYDMEYTDATDTILNPIYSICIAVWSTAFVESWKQK